MTGAPGPAAGPPPGWLHDLAARLAGTAVPAGMRPPPEGGRRSAVLILFGPGVPGRESEPDAGPDLLLIQRRAGLRRHGGQPAFPGGAIEPSDTGPAEAALREAAEEVGLEPAGVDVVGTAPELFIWRSGFRVVPVIGWWRQPVAIRPADPGEVASVARVGVAELADPANRIRIRHPSGTTGPAFRVHGMLVWGFTGALLDLTLRLGGWEQPWDAGRLEDLPAEALAAAEPDGLPDRAGHGP